MGIMNKKEIYRKLQRHLNNQPVGFPSSLTGRDLKLLKHFFTPEEAEAALLLDHRFTPFEEIAKRKKGVTGFDSLERLLNTAMEKGGVAYRIIEGKECFALHPLIVGMYEGHLYDIRPEFIKDFQKYTGSLSFGISYFATEVPQMRTIPIEESITPEHKISSFDEIKKLLQQAEGEILVVDCICRKSKSIQGEKCKATDRTETCIVVNGMAHGLIKTGYGRIITREEAEEILRKNVNDGLVLQTLNSQKPEFICSCCGCCCGMLAINQRLPDPASYWPSNYFAIIDESKCIGCGRCEKICQMNALKTEKPNPEKKPAYLNLKKCIGCGNCVNACKPDAISLCKKENEIIPPKDHEDLYEIIGMNKKTGWEGFKSLLKAFSGR